MEGRTQPVERRNLRTICAATNRPSAWPEEYVRSDASEGQAEKFWSRIDELKQRAIREHGQQYGLESKADRRSRELREAGIEAERKVGRGGIKPLAGQTSFLDRPAGPAGEAGVPGGSLTNSPPANSQGRSAGGEDWGDVACFCTWDLASWVQFTALVTRCQLAARNQDDQRRFFEIDNKTVEVLPRGIQKANGGPAYKFVLVWLGIRFEFMDRPLAPESCPNVLMHFGSELLMDTGGIEWAYGCALLLLSELGCRVDRNVLSRVDACLDVVGLDVEPVVKAFLAHDYVCVARQDEVFSPDAGGGARRQNGRWSGCGFGGKSARIKCRIYDKELETRNNPSKRALLVARRWGGVEPDTATRIEFQLRREALKSCGVESVEDWVRCRGPILHYLCTKWVRFVAPITDRTHSARSKPDPWWEAVIRGFLGWASLIAGGEKSIVRSGSRVRDPKKLLAQAVGCISSAVAGSHGLVGSAAEVVSCIVAAVTAEVTGRAGVLMDRINTRAYSARAAGWG